MVNIVYIDDQFKKKCLLVRHLNPVLHTALELVGSTCALNGFAQTKKKGKFRYKPFVTFLSWLNLKLEIG